MCAYYAPQPYQTAGMPLQGQASFMSVQSSPQDKINRELFVGNTPPGTSEVLLLHFCNAAMRRVGLCQPYETPVLNSRVNNKFAFIELVSPEMANKALSLSGIPFLGGTLLKVSRPSKYAGPVIQTPTWQQLTGQSIPDSASTDADQEKLRRELFIGNTTPEMTETMLRDFLGNAMHQVGLTTSPGNPIATCRVSGKFAFVELRTAAEAAAALNLNNIPYMGATLRVGRPSKYSGPPDQHGNWEDILAKFMSGELQLPASATTSGASAPSSRVVELQNMVSDQDLVNPEEYQDLLDDIREECAQFGHLNQVIIPKAGQVGATKVFLEYATTEDAGKAVQALEGRTFDGRRVQAIYFPESRFAANDYA
jgi:hypothetical protein